MLERIEKIRVFVEKECVANERTIDFVQIMSHTNRPFRTLRIYRVSDAFPPEQPLHPYLR